MKCPKCSTLNTDANKFCISCGFSLVSTQTKSPPSFSTFSTIGCPDCGKEIPSESKYCPHCGASLLDPSKVRADRESSLDQHPNHTDISEFLVNRDAWYKKRFKRIGLKWTFVLTSGHLILYIAMLMSGGGIPWLSLNAWLWLSVISWVVITIELHLNRYHERKDALFIWIPYLGAALWWFWALRTHARGLQRSENSISERWPSGVLTGNESETFDREIDLENFIIQTWNEHELGRKYDLLEENGMLVSQQYKAEGQDRIDLLVKEKHADILVVIELKLKKMPYETAGQVAKYMGWVTENLKCDGVKGIIIGGKYDKKLDHAAKMIPNLQVFLYDTKSGFKLKEYK